MTGWLISVEPVLVRAGPLTIRWFGVLLVLGLAAGLWLTIRRAARSGLAPGLVLDLASWALPAGLVGARALHVLEAWEYYVTRPLEVLDPGGAGLSAWGALVGGGLATLLLAGRRGALSRLADAAVPGLALAELLGRLGSFLNGDGLGRPTQLPWGVRYQSLDAQSPDFGVPRHPAQLYQALADLALLGLAFAPLRRLPAGVRFWLWLGLYGASRVGVGLIRLDPPFLFGWQLAQLIGLAAIVVSGLALPRAVGRRTVTAAPGPG